MSEILSLSDLIKSLPTASETTGKSVILSDTDGALCKALSYGILDVRMFTRNKSGAMIFSNSHSKGIALVLAVDDNNQENYCLYLFIKLKTGENGKTHIISNKVVTISATNIQSTVAMTGAENITQYILQLA